MRTNRAPKKTPKGDWHPADIKAALEKAGWSLRRLSIHHKYKNASTLKHALHRKYPKAQKLIAEAIGVHPATIWPSRYPADGMSGATSSPKAHRGARAA